MPSGHPPAFRGSSARRDPPELSSGPHLGSPSRRRGRGRGGWSNVSTGLENINHSYKIDGIDQVLRGTYCDKIRS